MPASCVGGVGCKTGTDSRDHEIHDLLECLAQVPDPRSPRGVRHPLAEVLALTACAVLAGARSLLAVSEWVAPMPSKDALSGSVTALTRSSRSAPGLRKRRFTSLGPNRRERFGSGDPEHQLCRQLPGAGAGAGAGPRGGGRARHL
ncbi:transposase family protein [Streptomyces sp. NPDC002701]|uniref:transposase family protein n=1 Tax=Streptomyces sp. NPDC002701 TaxID=3364661 RepID=UPI0036C9E218